MDVNDWIAKAEALEARGMKKCARVAYEAAMKLQVEQDEAEEASWWADKRAEDANERFFEEGPYRPERPEPYFAFAS